MLLSCVLCRAFDERCATFFLNTITAAKIEVSLNTDDIIVTRTFLQIFQHSAGIVKNLHLGHIVDISDN